MDAATVLADTNAIANLAVRDLAKARAFFGDVLGLSEIAGGDDNLVSYRSGDSRLIVYRSEYAGTNQATAVTWVVGDRVDAIVAALRDKGVRFEHYDNMPETRREGDVHVGCGMRVAWFKDPDGNILNVVSG
jgi:catechol 2,3-dioxygenase-like lactoylglutathione lyase family enzyme